MGVKLINKILQNVVSEYVSKMAEVKWMFLRSLREVGEETPLSEAEKEYAFSRLNPAHVTTKRSVDIGKYSIGASFKISMVHHILEKRQYKKFSIAPAANDKLQDAKFITSLGYPVPKVFSSSATVNEALEYTGCIVKSITGAASKGVFLNEGSTLYHFFDKKRYGQKEFVDYCGNNKIKKFIVEEYVGGDDGVTDLKFYMFYGEVGAVLEVHRGSDGNRHCFYDGNSEIVNTGRYRETAFEGGGFSQDQKECAMEISASIPSPFVRVDLISNGKEFWVGEITAHPGGFEDFNKEWDFFLGVMFIQAKARLLEDLLQGKSFATYLNRGNKKGEFGFEDLADEKSIGLDFSVSDKKISPEVDFSNEESPGGQV